MTGRSSLYEPTTVNKQFLAQLLIEAYAQMWIVFGDREKLERPLADVSEGFASKTPLTFRQVLYDERARTHLVKVWGLPHDFQEAARERLRRFSFSPTSSDFGRKFPLVPRCGGAFRGQWRFQAVVQCDTTRLSRTGASEPEDDEPHPDVTFLTPTALSSLVASNFLKDSVLLRCQRVVHMVSWSRPLLSHAPKINNGLPRLFLAYLVAEPAGAVRQN